LRIGYVAWIHRPKTVTLTPVPKTTSSQTEAMPLGGQSLQQALIENLKLKPAPLPSELLKLELAPAGTTSVAPKSPPISHVYLAIHQGPARSEVQLNGITLGQTPFVGEITCKRGEPLEFVLIPPKGMPRRSSHICDRTEITITDKTPESSRP
jgi:hypothetical protein